MLIAHNENTDRQMLNGDEVNQNSLACKQHLPISTKEKRRLLEIELILWH